MGTLPAPVAPQRRVIVVPRRQLEPEEEEARRSWRPFSAAATCLPPATSCRSLATSYRLMPVNLWLLRVPVPSAAGWGGSHVEPRVQTAVFRSCVPVSSALASDPQRLHCARELWKFVRQDVYLLERSKDLSQSRWPSCVKNSTDAGARSSWSDQP